MEYVTYCRKNNNFVGQPILTTTRRNKAEAAATTTYLSDWSIFIKVEIAVVVVVVDVVRHFFGNY
jgi:hypothetical protein